MRHWWSSKCWLWHHPRVKVRTGSVHRDAGMTIITRYECPCQKYLWLSDWLGTARFKNK